MDSKTNATKLKEKLFWIFGIFFCAACVFLALIPTILSTTWGKNQSLKLLNHRFNGKIEIQELSLSWFGEQAVKGLVLVDANAGTIGKIDQVNAEASLISLLFGYIPGQSAIKGMELEIVPYSDGTTNLDYFLKRATPSAKASKLPSIQLQDIEANGGNSPALNLLLTGKTSINKKNGTFKVNVTTLPEQDQIQVDAKISQFPVFVLDQIVALNNPKMKGVLLAILGKTLSINVSQTIEGAKSGGTSALMKTLLKVVSDKAHLTLEANPNEDIQQVALKMTVEGMAPPPFLSIDPEDALAKFVGSLFNVEINGDFHLHKERFGAVDNIHIVVQNELVELLITGAITSDQRFVMNAPAVIKWKNTVSDLILTVSPFDISLVNPSIEALEATVHLDGLQNNSIHLDWNRHVKTLVAEGSFNEFPLGRISPELKAVFGPSVSGSVEIKVKENNRGPIFLSLKGTNGRFSLDGHYENGFLVLNKPIEGSIGVTEELGRVVLKRFAPALNGLVSGDRPISFQIEKEGFTLPLFPFVLEKASFNQAYVDLGVLNFQNRGPLGKTLSFLKLGNESLLSMWFTPVYLSLNGGNLKIERVDALLQGAYPLAAWGDVDIVQQTIDMQVGLSAQAISRAFNVQIGGQDSYIAIPLKGPLQNPSFDKTSATAQISSLAALNQAGPPGKILGAVLQIASGSSLGSNGVPPPITNPLPWAGQLQEENAQDSPSTTMTKPIKSISEGAEKLLKSLFR